MACYFKKDQEGTTFICGDLGMHCGECNWYADYLCDYPVGEGKTCDKPLCNAHANEVAPDVHYCSAHYGMWKEFKESGGVERELKNVVPYSEKPKE